MTMSAALDVARRLDDGRSRRKKRCWAGLRRMRLADEAIEMLQLRNGYFPKAFRWRGRRYEVSVVERCWMALPSGFPGSAARHAFRVQTTAPAGASTDSKTVEIYRDQRRDTWHIRP